LASARPTAPAEAGFCPVMSLPSLTDRARRRGTITHGQDQAAALVDRRADPSAVLVADEVEEQPMAARVEHAVVALGVDLGERLGVLESSGEARIGEHGLGERVRVATVAWDRAAEGEASS